MLKRIILGGLLTVACVALMSAFGPAAQAAPPGQPSDWQRFYYYPYVYYPHNYAQLPESYNHLYYRYPNEKRIPVYNQDWYNFYPTKQEWYKGHHYIMDVF